MSNNEKSGSLDIFRVAAAVLVIMIHTSPLENISADADFFLTRILARVAVPFFFTVTGMFTNFGRPRKTLIKLSGMYLLVTALYIPFGIISGYFKGFTFWKAVRMLLFDGYFYHLWYFPACILGIIIVHFLKKTTAKKALIIAALLYLLGLLGDGYYGLAAGVPPLKAFYGALFNVFSYTRNGLFFAPIFLLLGSNIGRLEFNGKNAAAGGIVSFALMTAEAFILRQFKLPRHDSMYIFLVPSAFFLIAFLKTLKARQRPVLRKLSMWVYIIHPAVIIALRGASKIISNDFFEKRALLLFVLTTLCSVGFALFAAYAALTFGKLRGALCSPRARTWAEIDAEALRSNAEYLQSLCPENSRLMAVVKANAYGHGAVLTARELNKVGIRAFCTATAAEGAELRRHGVKGEILVLGYTHPPQFPLLKFFGLSQTVVDHDYAKTLNGYGKFHVHIGVDTGMRRLGIRSENYSEIKRIFEMKNLKVDGMFTHLSSDETTAPSDRAFTEKQAEKFFGTADKLAADGHFPKLHLLASCGLLNYPHLGGDYVRAGIALYGGVEREGLTPVLSLKTRVTSVRNVYGGEPVGYGLDCAANGNMRVAALAVGYADGLPRALSDGVGAVLINGKRAPMIGKICMDQTIVDVTEIDVKQGDIAVIIGNSGRERITVFDIARQAGTIPNDILSGLGSRVVRVIK
ncbi:MAG: alanine racemase [Ruminococcaceae bacterium]|nr:alanine racemase [Oscillospiraceae bacterium]